MVQDAGTGENPGKFPSEKKFVKAGRKLELDSDEERTIEMIKANFSCAICISLTEEPCMTPCGHLFCSECLMQWVHSSEETVCPKCRRMFRIDNIVNVSNGCSIKQRKYNFSTKKKILRPGFSAQNMKFGGIIIYQQESKKPAFRSIMAITCIFLASLLLCRRYFKIWVFEDLAKPIYQRMEKS